MNNRKKTLPNSEHPLLNLLATWATIMGITIITIIQVLTSIWSTIPCVKICREEKKVEKIKVSQSYEFVESVLGKPYLRNTYDYPSQDSESSIIGSKAIFGLDYSTIIAYFDQDNSLFGYFLVAKNRDFKPNQYKSMNIFGEQLVSFSSKNFNGYQVAISSSSMIRTDGNSHFMKYYYHHLSTNACIVGVGVSSIGYCEDIDFYSYSTGNDDDFIANDGAGIEYELYQERFRQIDTARCNAFSLFIGDGKIDTLAFLKEETHYKLGITDIEINRLVD